MTTTVKKYLEDIDKAFADAIPETAQSPESFETTTYVSFCRHLKDKIIAQLKSDGIVGDEGAASEFDGDFPDGKEGKFIAIRDNMVKYIQYSFNGERKLNIILRSDEIEYDKLFNTKNKNDKFNLQDNGPLRLLTGAIDLDDEQYNADLVGGQADAKFLSVIDEGAFHQLCDTCAAADTGANPSSALAITPQASIAQTDMFTVGLSPAEDNGRNQLSRVSFKGPQTGGGDRFGAGDSHQEGDDELKSGFGHGRSIGEGVDASPASLINIALLSVSPPAQSNNTLVSKYQYFCMRLANKIAAASGFNAAATVTVEGFDISDDPVAARISNMKAFIGHVFVQTADGDGASLTTDYDSANAFHAALVSNDKNQWQIALNVLVNRVDFSYGKYDSEGADIEDLKKIEGLDIELGKAAAKDESAVTASCCARLAAAWTSCCGNNKKPGNQSVTNPSDKKHGLAMEVNVASENGQQQLHTTAMPSVASNQTVAVQPVAVGINVAPQSLADCRFKATAAKDFAQDLKDFAQDLADEYGDDHTINPALAAAKDVEAQIPEAINASSSGDAANFPAIASLCYTATTAFLDAGFMAAAAAPAGGGDSDGDPVLSAAQAETHAKAFVDIAIYSAHRSISQLNDDAAAGNAGNAAASAAVGFMQALNSKDDVTVADCEQVLAADKKIRALAKDLKTYPTANIALQLSLSKVEAQKAISILVGEHGECIQAYMSASASVFMHVLCCYCCSQHSIANKWLQRQATNDSDGVTKQSANNSTDFGNAFIAHLTGGLDGQTVQSKNSSCCSRSSVSSKKQFCVRALCIVTLVTISLSWYLVGYETKGNNNCSLGQRMLGTVTCEPTIRTATLEFDGDQLTAYVTASGRIPDDTSLRFNSGKGTKNSVKCEVDSSVNTACTAVLGSKPFNTAQQLILINANRYPYGPGSTASNSLSPLPYPNLIAKVFAPYACLGSKCTLNATSDGASTYHPLDAGIQMIELPEARGFVTITVNGMIVKKPDSMQLNDGVVNHGSFTILAPESTLKIVSASLGNNDNYRFTMKVDTNKEVMYSTILTYQQESSYNNSDIDCIPFNDESGYGCLAQVSNQYLNREQSLVLTNGNVSTDNFQSTFSAIIANVLATDDGTFTFGNTKWNVTYEMTEGFNRFMENASVAGNITLTAEDVNGTEMTVNPDGIEVDDPAYVSALFANVSAPIPAPTPAPTINCSKYHNKGNVCLGIFTPERWDNPAKPKSEDVTLHNDATAQTLKVTGLYPAGTELIVYRSSVNKQSYLRGNGGETVIVDSNGSFTVKDYKLDSTITTMLSTAQMDIVSFSAVLPSAQPANNRQQQASQSDNSSAIFKKHKYTGNNPKGNTPPAQPPANKIATGR